MHKTDYDLVPTHVFPEVALDSTVAFTIKEGQSVPRPGSSKHVLHGPSFLITTFSGWYEYTLIEDDPWSAPHIDENWNLDYCRENVPILDLEANV